MSHYSGHVPPGPPPPARVAFFGMSLAAVGFFGFFTYIKRRHERKHAFDRAHEDRAKVSSWEYRLLQRGQPTASSPSMLRSARTEGRSAPLAPPTTEHNGQHRTFGKDNSSSSSFSVDSSGRPLAFSQPTAQKGHSDGRQGVYTKNPGWREQAHYATGGKSSEMGPGDGGIDAKLGKM